MIKLTPEMEAHRCTISARDCDAARMFLEAYEGLKEKDNQSGTNEFSTHREGLLLAAIVSYSRAFINSDGEEFATRKVKVDLDKVFKKDARKIKLHNTILERRNNAVAHSTWKYNETKVIEASQRKWVLRKSAVVDYGKGIDLEVFRDIAETMCEYFQGQALERDIAIKAKPNKEG